MAIQLNRCKCGKPAERIAVYDQDDVLIGLETRCLWGCRRYVSRKVNPGISDEEYQTERDLCDEKWNRRHPDGIQLVK